MNFIISVMRIWLVMLILSMYGCTHQPVQKSSEANFNLYLMEFAIQSQGLYNIHELNNIVTVKFHDYGENDEGIVGTCFYKSFVKNEIWINKEWWNSKYRSPWQKAEVLFHELGHCVLNRPHTIPPIYSTGFRAWFETFLFDLGIFKKQKDYLKDGCPNSMMYPYTISTLCVMLHYDHYMNELFGRM